MDSMVRDAFSLTPWLGRSSQDKVRVTETCREALLLGSNVFGVHHAARTAGVYHFNPQHIQEDEEAIRKDGVRQSGF